MNTSYTHDSVSRLLSVLHQAGGVTVDGASYTLDAVGNRTAKANLLNGVSENYSYDAIYQLSQVVQGANTTESYSYDQVGNRLSSLGVSPYSYNNSNELTSTPGVSYTYDNNGNTLTKTDANGTTSYTWDFENRLLSVTLPGTGGTVTFKYDPFGRRVQKSGPSGTTNYLYDGANILEDVDGTGTVLARYTQGAGIDEPLAMLRGGVTDYYQADGLGSITSVRDAGGALVASYTYDTFGNLAASTGTLTNPFRYTGREFDSETGLYYYRARYYDPSVSRFISEDRLRFGGGRDFYAYVHNNPAGLNDPLGLCDKKDCIPVSWLKGMARVGYLTPYAAYEASRAGAWLTGGTVGVGVGGGFGFGLGPTGYVAVGAGGYGSGVFETDGLGNSALVITFTAPVEPTVLQSVQDDVGYGANFGVQITAANTLVPTKPTATVNGPDVNGSFGPVGADWNPSSVSLQLGVGAGARFGASVGGTVSVYIPICKE